MRSGFLQNPLDLKIMDNPLKAPGRPGRPMRTTRRINRYVPGDRGPGADLNYAEGASVSSSRFPTVEEFVNANPQAVLKKGCREEREDFLRSLGGVELPVLSFTDTSESAKEVSPDGVTYSQRPGLWIVSCENRGLGLALNGVPTALGPFAVISIFKGKLEKESDTHTEYSMQASSGMNVEPEGDRATGFGGWGSWYANDDVSLAPNQYLFRSEVIRDFSFPLLLVRKPIPKMEDYILWVTFSYGLEYWMCPERYCFLSKEDRYLMWCRNKGGCMALVRESEGRDPLFEDYLQLVEEFGNDKEIIRPSFDPSAHVVSASLYNRRRATIEFPEPVITLGNQDPVAMLLEVAQSIDHMEGSYPMEESGEVSGPMRSGYTLNQCQPRHQRSTLVARSFVHGKRRRGRTASGRRKAGWF